MDPPDKCDNDSHFFHTQKKNTPRITLQHPPNQSRGHQECVPDINHHPKSSSFFDLTLYTPPRFLLKSQFQPLYQLVLSLTESTFVFTSIQRLSTLLSTHGSPLYLLTRKQLDKLIPHVHLLHPTSLQQAGIQSWKESTNIFLVNVEVLVTNIALSSSFSNTVMNSASSTRDSLYSSSPTKFFDNYYHVLSSHLPTFIMVPHLEPSPPSLSSTLSAASPGWTFNDVLYLLQVGQRHCELTLPDWLMTNLAHHAFQKMDPHLTGYIQASDFQKAAMQWDPTYVGLWCHPKKAHLNPTIHVVPPSPPLLPSTPLSSNESLPHLLITQKKKTLYAPRSSVPFTPLPFLTSPTFSTSISNTWEQASAEPSKPLPSSSFSPASVSSVSCSPSFPPPMDTSRISPVLNLPLAKELPPQVIPIFPPPPPPSSSSSTTTTMKTTASSSSSTMFGSFSTSFFFSPTSDLQSHPSNPPLKKTSFSTLPKLIPRWWRMKGQHWSILTILLFTCVLFFSLVFINYSTDPVLTRSFGYALAFAKGSAGIIHLTVIFLMLSMCRWLTTQFHHQWPWLPIHKLSLWHRYAGMLLVLASLIHTVAHVTVTLPVVLRQPAFQAKFLKEDISVASSLQNPFPKGSAPRPALYWFLLATPSWTGWTLVGLLFIITLTSVPKCVRKAHFEVFYYTHFLFFVFLAILCLHGTASWLSSPTSWKFLLFPTSLYVGERLWRAYRTYTSPALLVCVKQEGDAVLLKLLTPPPFRMYKPGQFMYLNVPCISKFQWHPFSVTSHPTSPYITFLVRPKGTWTQELMNFMKPSCLPPCQVYVDGVFGGYPHYHQYSHIIFVASGIGCTPFLSLSHALPSTTLVDFIWITRSMNEFDGVIQGLPRLQSHPLFRIHVYLTSVCVCEPTSSLFWNTWQSYQANHHGIPFSSSDLDLPLHPHVFVYWGRPNLPRVLKSLSLQTPKKTIGVYFCGAKPLGKKLSRFIYDWNMDARHQVVFKLHKESF
ncbi:NADPH oxidase 4 [Coelomomyces lativittatus]|nr:NADPH oxidase 4 [Coelomomyces lativittatus]KAJ1503872.1 NADPH oxidase 4 [Coelomomyces lativittatus]